jgi:hypothetical protein
MKTLSRLSLPVMLAALIALMPMTALAQSSGIQFNRPADQFGLNVFEAPKEDTTVFTGMNVKWGAAFTQQFQALSHETASEVEIANIGAGFNLATANLNLDAQLADGVRVNLITYLSSRHHPEAWVKGGYFQIDGAPMFRSPALDRMFEFVTLRVGHFEINYGDAHFRRTDNGNAMHNAFVGNFLMDAFTTEIGTELYFRSNGFLAMGGVTGGEIRGNVQRPDDRKPTFLGKLGYDSQLTPDLRMRLTGSVYHTAGSISNTLYGGDRAGARYYDVLEGGSFSGRVNPGMRDKVTAFQINPFIKVRGLELFGIIETASGRAANEVEDRTWNQYAAEAIYRFGPREQIYFGGRYNVVNGPLASGHDVTVDRFNIGGGWFVTPNVLAKIEYVNQSYDGYPSTDARHGGRFNGIMVEGVLAF